MAHLPQDRISPDKSPFRHVGVDYFRPFEVKLGRSVVKRYLFPRLLIGAVEIEVSTSLDTDSFILYHFVAAECELKDAIKTGILSISMTSFFKGKLSEFSIPHPVHIMAVLGEID